MPKASPLFRISRAESRASWAAPAVPRWMGTEPTAVNSERFNAPRMPWPVKYSDLARNTTRLGVTSGMTMLSTNERWLLASSSGPVGGRFTAGIRQARSGGFGGWPLIWQTSGRTRLSAAPLSASGVSIRASRAVSPRGCRGDSTQTRNRSHHHSGRQDSFEAHGQDPCTVLPCRHHELAHQARWPGDRGDRQVPPDPRALDHRDRLRACAVLARGRRATDRAGRRATEDHG